MVLLGAGHWLRIPVGKLHNDRYVPLTPSSRLLTDWTAPSQRRTSGWSPDQHGSPSTATDRSWPQSAGPRLGHVHPHHLRHTLATQAINRGMRLEAIAALLGHRPLA